MTYKDPDKQREANRQAQAKFKAKGITEALVEGITEGITLQKKMGITEGISEKVLPDAELKAHFAKPKRGKDIKCFADLPPAAQLAIKSLSMDETGYVDEKEKARRTAIAINYQHQTGGQSGFRSKLGDADYTGVRTPERVE